MKTAEINAKRMVSAVIFPNCCIGGMREKESKAKPAMVVAAAPNNALPVECIVLHAPSSIPFFSISSTNLCDT